MLNSLLIKIATRSLCCQSMNSTIRLFLMVLPVMMDTNQAHLRLEILSTKLKLDSNLTKPLMQVQWSFGLRLHQWLPRPHSYSRSSPVNPRTNFWLSTLRPNSIVPSSVPLWAETLSPQPLRSMMITGTWLRTNGCISLVHSTRKQSMRHYSSRTRLRARSMRTK